MSDSTYAFVELKSFGDMVITASSIRRLSPGDAARCRLLIGPYLNDLAAALAPPCRIESLPIPDRNVPALFDLKKRGIAAGLSSAVALRTALSRVVPDATLVLPRPARRERFIAGRRVWRAIPPAENVYLAFERFMRETFQDVLVAPIARVRAPRRIALCPFSRVTAKNVPSHRVTEMATVCVSMGFEPELLLLEGERLDALTGGLAVRTIPRRFDALADALAEYAGVISADSLPAHLAEYRGTPTFVASPVPNTYWLPLRAFQGEHWGLIDQAPALTARLQRFLSTAQP